MKTKRGLLPLICLAAGLLPGCVATTTDIDRLADSLRGMEQSQARMQKSQADLTAKMDELDHSLVTLSEKLDDSQKKNSALAQKLDDLNARMGGGMERISTLLSEATTQASVPVPGELYRSAFGDYQAGRYDLAMSGFRSFLERYPNSDLAESAQFYLADSYLIKKKFSEARAEFDQVLGSSRQYRPQALLKRSYALAGMDQTKAQKDTLKALIKEFPTSAEAQTAKQILDELDEPSAKPKPKSKPAKKKAE